MTVPLEVISAIDRALFGRALVYGSLPPSGRDLDLVVGPEDELRAAEALAREGFTATGSNWIAVRGCSASLVELIPARSLRLSDDEVEALFDRAVPIHPWSLIAAPSPHDTLLILARRLARSRGPLAEKHRARIDGALAADRSAWDRARARAAAWDGERPLERLREAYSGRPETRARALPLPRRFFVLTGADSETTAWHAKMLIEMLESLGFDSCLVRTSGRWAGRWRAGWQRDGRTVAVVVEATRAAAPKRFASLAAPRPLRTFVIDPSHTSREERCEAVAVHAWQALTRRRPLRAVLRRVARLLRAG